MWFNVDDLHAQFGPDAPERAQIDAERNYINHDITKTLPFAADEFDGVLLSHVIEHFDAQTGLAVLREARRVLKPGGCVVASVPDASYFRKVYNRDKVENWPELFGVTDPANPIPTFFEAALWFDQHKTILTEDALWAYLTRAGFVDIRGCDLYYYAAPPSPGAIDHLIEQLNRLPFSLIMTATKQ